MYVDADYASKDNDRCSLSGMAVMVGGPVVNTSSTSQHCVTMPQGANTALFTKAVLDFLQPELANETIDSFEDNQ